MDLPKELKKVVLSLLSDFAIINNRVLCVSNTETQIINMLIAGEVISKEDVEKALHSVLLRVGRECYKQHTRGEYPDHTISPEALAYAILHGEFTQKERDRIRFDHRETESDFTRVYGKNVLEKIVQSVLVERTPVVFEGGLTCSCGECGCSESH